MLGQCISGLACILPSKSGRPLVLPSSSGSGLGSGKGGSKGSIGSHHIGRGRPARGHGGVGRAVAHPWSARPGSWQGEGPVASQRPEGGRRQQEGPPWSARPWPWQGEGAAAPRGWREAGGARSGRPGFWSGWGGSVGSGLGHAGGKAGWRKAGGGGSGHAGVEEGQREAGGSESGRGRPAAPDLAALASDPGGGRLAAPDLATPVSDPAMVAVPSPHGGGAIGKWEEEATGDEKEKTGLTEEGSPAMEAAAAAPVAGEMRGEGGEPNALIPCRKCWTLFGSTSAAR
ncbi:hypothetical protein GUJ93_ZPchr0009g1221 [Zizania palustris]|uniref:Uncharacterized protein n=1 Tax=Zizania palustris TaxID=103762 RepID=A0A8J5S5W8_ZIZPA|nr:hypothetical protein GUJ93_ZPchr0009g1221 [Zizania palustris]